MALVGVGASTVRVFDVSGVAGASEPEAIGGLTGGLAKRARRKAELSRGVDLLQDFECPTVTSRVKATPDGEHVFLSGSYPPQLRCFDVRQLSLKFRRHLDADIVDFQALTDDWRKLALLTADRRLALHSQMGAHFSVRVPRFGRDLAIHAPTAEVFVAAAGPEVYRLNLERGMFMPPLRTRSGASSGGGARDDARGNNVVGVNPINHLVAFGGDGGVVEVWDPRTLTGAAGRDQPAGRLDVAAALAAAGVSPSERPGAHPAAPPPASVTSLRFDSADGLTMGVGTGSGHVLLFDLRSPRARLVKDHGYDSPVVSLKLHADGRHALSADAHALKVWGRSAGETVAVVEPDARIAHTAIPGASGLVCVAVEAPRVRSYYIPALGPAPRWCSHLDAFTDEADEAEEAAARARRVAGEGGSAGGGGAGALPVGGAADSVYANYKFVTDTELGELGLESLKGTPLAKPYLHGFFVDLRLYRKAADAASPFAYDEYRSRRAAEAVEREQESRIGAVVATRKAATPLPKVNAALAVGLLAAREARRAENARRRGAAATSATPAAAGGADAAGDAAVAPSGKVAEPDDALADDRFASLFTNPDFVVEETDQRFRQLNPQKAKQADEAAEAAGGAGARPRGRSIQ